VKRNQVKQNLMKPNQVKQSSAKQSSVKNHGVTLVEVLVALAIIGVVGGMFSYFVSSLQTTQSAREQTTAVAYARAYLEGLRAKWQTLEGYQNVSLATPPEPPSTYDLKIEIKNDQGSVVYGYPGGAATEDLSALRTIKISFTNEEDKTISLVTTLARPTPLPGEASSEEN
jgi:prepilin-type N-terminal cleavage/methylation domain-containing protein